MQMSSSSFAENMMYVYVTHVFVSLQDETY